MSTLDIQPASTIGSLVAQRPALAQFLEHSGIDYCCGGKKSIEEVCVARRWSVSEFIAELQGAAEQTAEESYVDAAAMSLTKLADHIEQTHHAYLRSELPRLKALTEKVAHAHGEKDQRLEVIRDEFFKFAQELSMHMMKEEQVLFPFVRQLEASETSPSFHCGSVANPIRQMEREHQDAGQALELFRDLTDGYQPPPDACNTYRVMLHSLARLERDMFQHVHKEDNVLFPRAMERERELALASESVGACRE